MALPPFGSAEREAHVRVNGASFEPETLVYLLRESIDRADTAPFHHLGRLLVGDFDGNTCTNGHCESIIMSVAIRAGLYRNEDRLQEFRSRVYKAMWQAIHEGSDAKHFWEERFGSALKDKCLEIARTLVKKYRRSDRDETDVDDASVQAMLSDNGRQSRHGLGAIDEAALQCALNALPQRQAQAGFLAWVEGRPIAGRSADSVAAVMGISEPAVHMLLSKARAKLETHPIVRELRGDT